MPVARARTHDFVGLFGVAFFLLVVGVVFYLNQNLLTEIRMLDIEKLRGRPVQQRRYYFMVHHGCLWEAKKDFLEWMERS